MYDCSKNIRGYHNDRVKLDKATTKKLKGHRDANRTRLRNGLIRNEDPLPEKHVRQGSDAMRTTVQHPANDYDIDDGAVFNREDLVGSQGADKTALDARKMVCAALQDGAFNTPPEVRKNCVRVYYNEGHHVDIPVYRQEAEDDTTVYELASSDWRKSDPEGVNGWFDGQLKAKHPDGTADYQMRRMTRLCKAFGRSRGSWNMPSGFIWTILVDEAFSWSDDGREDGMLRDIMRSIRNRLRTDKRAKNPVVDEYVTKTDADACMCECGRRLADALKDLGILDNPSCTRSKALKAWRKVLNTDYFDDAIEQADEDEKAKAKSLVASVGAVRPSPWFMADRRRGR